MVRPGLSFWMRESFQFLIWPVKIAVIVAPDRRRLVILVWPMCRLYMNVVPPAVSGMYANGRDGGLSRFVPSCTPYGMSDAAQSVASAANWLRPVVEPSAW